MFIQRSDEAIFFWPKKNSDFNFLCTTLYNINSHFPTAEIGVEFLLQAATLQIIIQAHSFQMNFSSSSLTIGLVDANNIQLF
jgi:hypothetical protein